MRSGAEGIDEREGSCRSRDSNRKHPGELAMTIADTDVLIDYLAGKGEADAVEQLLRHGALRTTVISRFELLSGAKNAKQLARLVQLLEAVPSLGLDDAAADAASEIRRSLERWAIPLAWPTV